MEKGTIQISITLPVELWNKMNKVRNIDNFGVSRFIQSAIRHHNVRVKKREIIEFMNNLKSNELELLKNEIKKRG